MTIPAATAKDLMQGRPEHDQQDFNDEILMDTPFNEMGGDLPPGRQAEVETNARAAEDLLLGLRQIQGGEDIRWMIHRVGELDDSRNGFLIECATTQLTQSWLRDQFGGGTYRIRGHYPNGKYAAQRTIRIAGDAPRQDKKLMNAGTGSNFDLGAFMAQQQQMESARERREQEREERKRREEEVREEKRRKDRNELLTILAPVAGTVATAFAGMMANRGPDIASLLAATRGPDPITLLTQLKALNSSERSSVTDRILPMLLEKIGSGSAGGESGWMDVIKELVKSAGPTVGGMIEAAVIQAKTNAAAIPTLPDTPAVPALPPMHMPMPRRRRVNGPSAVGSPDSSRVASFGPVDTAGEQSRTEPADMNLMALMPLIPWLKDQLVRMGTAATRGKDPELYAALFLEELPDEIDVQVVGQLLAREDWFVQLARLEPRLRQDAIVPWFEALRGHLLAAIQSELGAHVATHSPPRPMTGGRAAVRVDVRGPDGDTRHATPTPAPKPAAEQEPIEIERPPQLPPLTGE